MVKRFWSAALAAALLAAPAATFAQEVAEPIAAEDNIGVTIGIDFTNEYISQGLIFENDGFIAQPYLEIGVTFTDWLSLTAGAWGSLHSEHTDAGAINAPGSASNFDMIYEIDYYIGPTFTYDKFSLSALYLVYTSPNDGFETSYNLDFSLSYDDTGLIQEDFALLPYVRLFFETDGKAGSGTDEGIYLELGVGPSFELVKSEDFPITLTIPAAIYLGFDDFYADDEAFGGVSIGAVLSTPLTSIIPTAYGEWSASLGLTYYYLNDEVQFGAFAGDNENRFKVTAGLSASF